MNQTNEPVALRPVSYANPQDILDYRNSYMVREVKTNFHTVPLWTQDQVDVLINQAVTITAAEYAKLKEDAENGWKESVIAWTVSASIHKEYAKGKDPFYSTRQNDFIKSENTCRDKFQAIKETK